MKILIISILLLFGFQSNSQVSWMNTYVPPGVNGSNTISSVRQTNDGGFIFVTFVWLNLDPALWLVKTDDFGDTLWTNTFKLNEADEFNDVRQTDDGGYIICGNSWNPFLVKTDQNGDTLWTRKYGGPNASLFNDIEQTTDGGYIMTGFTNWPNEVLWLVKTNAQGDTLWTKEFDDLYSQGNDVELNPSTNGYIISGNRGSGAGWLLKTYSTGDTVWTRSFADNSGKCVDLFNNGYIMSGNNKLTHIDLNGNFVWSKTYFNGITQEGHAAQDGGYVLAGHTVESPSGSAEAWIFKIDQNGDSLWRTSFGNFGNYFFSVDETFDGGFILGGHTYTYTPSGPRVWLVKLDGNGQLETPEHDDNDFMLYPNPVQNVISVSGVNHDSETSVAIYSISGECLLRSTVVQGSINVSSLPSGIYYLELSGLTAEPFKFSKE